MNLQELIAACHGASKSAGWWNDLGTGLPIDPLLVAAEKIALCHSEVTEAYIADMGGSIADIGGSMDDKLQDRLGFEVELADVVIRCADLLGALGEAPCNGSPEPHIGGTTQSLLEIHAYLSAALEALRKGRSPSMGLTYAIKHCLTVESDSFGTPVDVMAAVHAKLAFNRERAGHKLEARRATNGKRF